MKVWPMSPSYFFLGALTALIRLGTFSRSE
jgi:hypothetical protein